jgi:hypothetical protein
LVRLLCLACSAGTLCVGPLHAQSPPASGSPPAGQVEVWGGFHTEFGGGSGEIESRYAPQVAFAPGAESSAGQTLALDAGTGLGVEVGANLFPARSLGLQVFVSGTGADIAGVNSPYTVQLRYVSRPPPDYQAVPVDLSQSVAWPDTTGTLRQLTVGVGPVARWRRPPLTVVAGGGLAWTRVSGEAESLGFTTYRLGGHSVLFADEFRLRLAFEPAWTVGGYLGGTLGVDLGRHLAITAGLRMLIAGDAEAVARIDTVSSSTGAATAPSPREVEAIMALDPVTLSPRRVALTIGFSLR